MSSNPLSKYFRQPAIYISLPSRGMFNDEIEKTALGEVGILPMTALDELSLKSPDKLLNGEATISVIKSCVPSIPDPRKLPFMDAEALLLAIKYATYGKSLDYNHTCSKCGEKNTFSVDINYVLDSFAEFDEVPVIEHESLKIYLCPPTLESMTKLSLIEMEQARIFESIKNSATKGDPEEDVAKRFYESYLKIAGYNIELIGNSILKIETPEGTITDTAMISEFIKNVDTVLVNKINDVSVKITKKPEGFGDFEFTCPSCEFKDKTHIEFNPVNFSTAG